jgi:hypothetical protein
VRRAGGEQQLDWKWRQSAVAMGPGLLVADAGSLTAAAEGCEERPRESQGQKPAAALEVCCWGPSAESVSEGEEVDRSCQACEAAQEKKQRQQQMAVRPLRMPQPPMYGERSSRQINQRVDAAHLTQGHACSSLLRVR